MQSLLCWGIDLSSIFGYAHLSNLNSISVSFQTASAVLTCELILFAFCLSFQIL